MFGHWHASSSNAEDPKPLNDGPSSEKSVSSSRNGVDAINQIEAEERAEEREEHEELEVYPSKEAANPSLDLRRTASNVLTKVATRMTTHSIVNPPPVPDGGLKAWTQVGMGWLVVFCTWGWVNSYGAFQSYYTISLGLPASTVSWIGSVQNFLTFCIGAFSGRLLDAGYFLPTMIVGVIIQLLGIFFMSLSTTYWQLMITQGVMTGIGGGIFFTPSMGLIGTYFSRKRPIAIGVTTTGNAAGGMIYPVLVQQLLPKIGFAWTARVLGFLNLGLLAAALAFMRPRLPPRKSGPAVDFSAFLEPTYAYFVAGLFFVIWAIYYTFYYLSSYGVDVVGLPFSTGISLTIIINGAGFPARVLPAFIAVKYGQYNTLIPILFILVIVSFCWLAVNTQTGLYTYAVFYGISSAAFQSLIPSTVASITTDMTKFGTRLGMAFGTLSFAALTGPPIGGAIQGAMQGSYLGAQIFAGLATAVAAGFIVTSRLSKTGMRLGVMC